MSEIVKLPNGVDVILCPACKGSGICHWCHGAGRDTTLFAMPWAKCRNCRNSPIKGMCPLCNGTGISSSFR